MTRSESHESKPSTDHRTKLGRKGGTRTHKNRSKEFLMRARLRRLQLSPSKHKRTQFRNWSAEQKFVILTLIPLMGLVFWLFVNTFLKK